MISLKTKGQLERMKCAGKVTAQTLELLKSHIAPGISTAELDRIAEEFILKNNCKPSCKNYHGYPKSICTSIDQQVVHGIPSENVFLAAGQIISIDIVAKFDGMHADAARTYAVGDISAEKQRLIKTTEESFWEAVKLIKPGAWLKDICGTIQDYNEARGYSLVRALTGHGIGKNMHEDPTIPNFKEACKNIKLESGMTLAIEPMVCAGSYEVEFAADGWTVYTRDGLPAAHYENTVAVTAQGYEIITSL